MIYDRTLFDVENAKLIRLNKVQQGETLTEAEITALERGTITINTLNRVEEKQKELKNLFNDMGYWNTPIVNKSWGYTDIFDITDFQQIIDNLNILRNAFFEYFDTPTTPIVSFDYKNINNLEKVLFDLDVMINDITSRYRQCGTFQCGEVNEN